jgi:hypothetical protein
MADHIESPPDVARARISAIHQAARKMCIATGGDPAECAFELVAAAILILHEARPTKKTSQMIAGIAPDAEAVVEEWFPEELKQFRCKHG